VAGLVLMHLVVTTNDKEVGSLLTPVMQLAIIVLIANLNAVGNQADR
jgi:hypothetical protein